MPQTSSRIEVHAPPGVVFGTLWDAGRYPEFLTDVIDVKVAAGAMPSLQTATLRTRLVREVTITIGMQGEAPALLTWRLRDGGGWLERYDVAFWIEDLRDGRSVQLGVEYEIEFLAAVPDAVVRRLFEFSLPTTLRQVKARAEWLQRRAEMRL